MEMSMTNVRRLVSKKELKGVLGIPYCPAHIARLEAAGEFPQRVKLGQCRVAWFMDEVVEWIESKARSRMAKPSH
jgi:prophage regulatory protein